MGKKKNFPTVFYDCILFLFPVFRENRFETNANVSKKKFLYERRKTMLTFLINYMEVINVFSKDE